MNVIKTWGLVLILAGAATAAACGSPPPPDAPPQGAPTAEPAPTGAPAADPTGAPATTSAPTAAAPSNAPVGMGANVRLSTTRVTEDLKKLGIDFKKAPRLENLPLAEKKKLMPLFQKALGFSSCKGCHAESDFKTVTRNMQITREMWAHFVAPMRDDKGGAVFCDSCHNGKSKLLDRSDKKVVAAFMEADYEHKLTRADGKENECSSCHGESMELKIIEKVWKIPN